MNELDGLLSKFWPRDPRPVPAACGLESERGGRTSSDLKSNEPAGSSDGCVTHRAGGMQQPEEPNLDLTEGGLCNTSLTRPKEPEEGKRKGRATPTSQHEAGEEVESGGATSTSL